MIVLDLKTAGDFHYLFNAGLVKVLEGLNVTFILRRPDIKCYAAARKIEKFKIFKFLIMIFITRRRQNLLVTNVTTIQLFLLFILAFIRRNIFIILHNEADFVYGNKKLRQSKRTILLRIILNSRKLNFICISERVYKNLKKVGLHSVGYIDHPVDILPQMINASDGEQENLIGIFITKGNDINLEEIRNFCNKCRSKDLEIIIFCRDVDLSNAQINYSSIEYFEGYIETDDIENKFSKLRALYFDTQVDYSFRDSGAALDFFQYGKHVICNNLDVIQKFLNIDEYKFVVTPQNFSLNNVEKSELIIQLQEAIIIRNEKIREQLSSIMKIEQ